MHEVCVVVAVAGIRLTTHVFLFISCIAVNTALIYLIIIVVHSYLVQALYSEIQYVRFLYVLPITQDMSVAWTECSVALSKALFN